MTEFVDVIDGKHVEALIEAAGERIGVTVNVRSSRVTSLVFKVFGRLQEDMGQVAEMLYLFERPLLVSHERFEAAFGADPTPHADALERTLEWYRDHPQYRG